MQSLSMYRFVILCFLIVACGPSLEAKNKKRSDRHALSIAAIFVDEAPYLREWIEYHKIVGATHFFLYNHRSTDNYREVLQPYIDSGDVDLFDWNFEPKNVGEWDKIQVNAYRDALKKAKSKTKWLAIIDTDEFLVPIAASTMVEYLKTFERSKLGGICLMWSFFGTSFVDKIPEDKLLIETLVYNQGPAAGGHRHNIWNQGAFKSIVRPDFVRAINSPHYCEYMMGFHHDMVDFNAAHINHYWTRDQHFLITRKVPRREFWGQTPDSVLSWAAGMNGSTEHHEILRFVSMLRKRMGLD